MRLSIPLLILAQVRDVPRTPLASASLVCLLTVTLIQLTVPIVLLAARNWFPPPKQQMFAFTVARLAIRTVSACMASFLVAGLLFWWPVVQPWPSVARWPRWLVAFAWPRNGSLPRPDSRFDDLLHSF